MRAYWNTGRNLYHLICFVLVPNTHKTFILPSQLSFCPSLDYLILFNGGFSIFSMEQKKQAERKENRHTSFLFSVIFKFLVVFSFFRTSVSNAWIYLYYCSLERNFNHNPEVLPSLQTRIVPFNSVSIVGLLRHRFELLPRNP